MLCPLYHTEAWLPTINKRRYKDLRALPLLNGSGTFVMFSFRGVWGRAYSYRQGLPLSAYCSLIVPCLFILGQILLVTSHRNPDRWVVPGGGIEPEEEPRIAAMREAMEEAGVRGQISRHHGVFEVSSCQNMAYQLKNKSLHQPLTRIFLKHLDCVGARARL